MEGFSWLAGSKNEQLKEEIKKLVFKIQINEKAIGGLKKALKNCRNLKQEETEKLKKALNLTFREIEILQKDLALMIKKYELLREEIKRPPNPYAIFWRMHPGGNLDEVDIITAGNELLKVLFRADGKQAKDVESGSQVLLGGAGLIIEVLSEPWPFGEKVLFKEKFDESRVLVTDQYNNECQCYLSPKLKDELLKPGDYLLNCHGIITKVLPKTEEEENFHDLEKLENLEWSQVGGLSKAVSKIKRKLLPLKEREAYLQLFPSRDIERGMILHGPEGCGKTLCAKVIASDLAKTRNLECYFIAIVGAELTNKYVGETSRKLRELFDLAKEKASEKSLVVIFIDEIDSLFRSRDAVSNAEPWMATDIGQFNGILQGMDPLSNILVIGATNRKDLIDKAILRPGRLGIDIEIPRPRTKKDIIEILRIYLTPNLPFADKYFQQDEYAYIDWFDEKQEKTVRLDKDKEKICDHFIDVIVNRIRYKGSPVKISYTDGDEKEELEVDNHVKAEINGEIQDVYLKDFLSGAILKSIVDGARGLAFERWCWEKERTGKEPRAEITKKDFFRAIDEEFKRLRNNFREIKDKPIRGFTA